MTIYYINPQSIVNIDNITNIMVQLTNDISNSIFSIDNIIIETQYLLMLNKINEILNNYLKIYYFYGFNISNIYVEIYNQNIVLVGFVYIKIYPLKYLNIVSSWNNFFNNIYYNYNKIVYDQLDFQQKNDLRYSIVSGKLYFIDNLLFLYKNVNTQGIILKNKSNNNCNCSCNSNNNYCYITTIYWN
jgi:hypothetical protein